MKDTLTIYMKNGEVIEFASDDFTDYEYRKSIIFIVYKNEQWVGIFSMSEVSCVIYDKD